MVVQPETHTKIETAITTQVTMVTVILTELAQEVGHNLVKYHKNVKNSNTWKKNML